MFSKASDYIYLILSASLVVVLLFALHYSNKSNILTERLKASDELNSRLSSQLISKQKELNEVVKTVKEQEIKVLDLSKKANDYKNEAEKITQKYNAERLNKIADKKEKLLEKVFNNGIKKEINDLNNIMKNERK